jgi:hypothetical protein
MLARPPKGFVSFVFIVTLIAVLSVPTVAQLLGLVDSLSHPPPALGIFTHNSFVSPSPGATHVDPVFGMMVRRVTTDHSVNALYVLLPTSKMHLLDPNILPKVIAFLKVLAGLFDPNILPKMITLLKVLALLAGLIDSDILPNVITILTLLAGLAVSALRPLWPVMRRWFGSERRYRTRDRRILIATVLDAVTMTHNIRMNTSRMIRLPTTGIIIRDQRYTLDRRAA